METNKTSLKDKLNIRDFICRGKTRPVLDKIMAYFLTAQKFIQQAEQNGSSTLLEMGFTPEMIDLGILSNKISSLSNKEIIELETDITMPTELDELILKRNELINRCNDIPENEQKEIKDSINALEEKIANIKKIHIENSIQIEYAKSLKNLKPSSTKLELVEYDTDGVLFKIENEIIDGFLSGKVNLKTGVKYDEKEISQIIDGNHELSFSKLDFYELCENICNEPENAVSSNAIDFFTRMRN